MAIVAICLIALAMVGFGLSAAVSMPVSAAIVHRTCTWMAAGMIMLFAIRVGPSFVDRHTAGIILVTRGAVELWLNLWQRAGRAGRSRWCALLRAFVADAAARIEALVAEPASGTVRVPLRDLLIGQDGDEHPKEDPVP
jgi:hypothetical protein